MCKASDQLHVIEQFILLLFMEALQLKSEFIKYCFTVFIPSSSTPPPQPHPLMSLSKINYIIKILLNSQYSSNWIKISQLIFFF